jgi:predicted MFS family arabinose efflux permease
MRFPFTFMGLLSVALGAWIGGYVVLHPSRDGVTLALEVLPALALIAFGGWLLYRRAIHGPAA